MPYFECNLPLDIPSYIDESRVEEMTDLMRSVHARTKKLEEALDISGLDGATFSEYAHTLFVTNRARFDSMSTDELANYVCLVHEPGYRAKERLEWPNATVLCDTAFLDTKEWEAIRHLGIGGSDAAVIQGGSPYRTPFGLYHDKVWTPKAGTGDDGKQAIFDRGHAMEDRVIQAFLDLTGAERVPETRMFQSRRYPSCIADVDAIVRFPDGHIYVFEAKTTVAENFDAWSGEKIPGHYVPQTRQYPAVLNDDRILGTYIGCLFTYDYTVHGIYVGSDTDVGRFVCRLVERNGEEEDYGLSLNQKFYEEHIVAKVVPEMTGTPENNKEAIAEIVGTANEDAPLVEIPGDMLGQIEDYLALKAKKSDIDVQSKTVKEAIDGIAIPFIALLGEAVEGRIPVPDSTEEEYYEVKYAPRKTTKVDTELLALKHPDAFAECVTVDPCSSRTFTIKVKKPKPVKQPKKKFA